MIEKAFDSISKADIEALIANAVGESRTLEYKQELPGTKDDDKKEFLADISSFGNAAGGDVLYGIKGKVNAEGKKTGEPEAVSPLIGTTPDQAKLRLEESIRSGIDPRLRVQIKEIVGWGDNGQGFVILIRIQKSFASPHMVIFKGSSRFFSRNSAGKYQLDVAEIRSAVLATDSQAERIKRFREERIGKIIADEIPFVLSSPHRLILHIVPIPSFLNRERLNLATHSSTSRYFRPISSQGWESRFNLDGYLNWQPERQPGDGVKGYCQLFFDGTIEAVFSELLRTDKGYPVRGGTGFIASIAYERDLITAVESYLNGYKELGVNGPLALSMAIVGCRGSYMYVKPSQLWIDYHPIDRDAIILPDVIIDDLNMNIPHVMKPLFDAVWNACGFPYSLNYDNQGNWMG
jgi:hypothetical protein